MQDRFHTVTNQARPIPGQAGAAASGGSLRRRRQQMLAAAAVALVIVLIAAGSFMLLSVGASGTADTSELARFDGHQAPVRCLAISADGELVASGDQRGSLLVWSAKKRQQRGQLVGHTAAVGSVSISLDAKLAASGDDDGAVRTWDLEHFRPKAAAAGHRGAVTSVIVYPAKTHLLSGGRDGRIVLWKLSDDAAAENCKLERQCSLGAAEVICLAMTPDGLRFLAGDSSGVLTLWNLADMRQLHRFEAHRGPIRGLAISPLGGQAVSCGDDGQVRRWDLERQRLVVAGKPPGDPAQQWAMAFSPGGTRALSTDSHGIVRLWSMNDMQVAESYSGHTAAATCGVFFPNGAIALTGSLDHSIRLWQLPLASELEVKQTTQAVDAARHRSDRLRKFGRQLELGQLAVKEEKLKQASEEFRAAQASVNRESLEYRTAAELTADVDAAERYWDLCKAGDAAAKEEEFVDAMENLKQAREVLRGRPEIDPEHKAQDGYETAFRLNQLKQALKGHKVTQQDLAFLKPAPKSHPLDAGKKFAFLLKKTNPPMALASTPLKWTIELETPVPCPDEKVFLKVQVWQETGSRPLAEVQHPFIVGQTEQSFEGQAQPPPAGWPAGNYQLRSSLVTGKKETVRDPVEFKIGVLDWTETKLELKPEAVQQAGYVVDAGLKVGRYDALVVKARGTIAPGPVPFYRELLVNPKIADPVPSQAAGLPWLSDAMRVHRYRMVDLKSNFGALLLRIGYEGSWMAYKEGAAAQLTPEAGPLHVSINSVVPAGFSPAGAPQSLTASERSYWAPDCGAYQVTILHGKFDFPVSLSSLQRGGLLLLRFETP
jgi:hypothetical protein